MIGQSISCENTGCDIQFVKKTHNQRYHDDECCRLATNAKIMEKYYAKRAQKLGVKRLCTNCDSQLSRYNSATICNPCALKNEVNKTQNVITMLSNVSWQS